ncbi:MAG: hypothetical protein GXP32_00645, partial [Kiritimatiellaeota bacterium]|nr:hypothetical protein [Kiritimatiellota bacterium]
SLYLKSFVDLNIWGLLWIALPVVLILNFRVLKEKYALAMWALLSAQIAVYFSAFIISPWSPGFLAGMALERILLHATPAVVYLIAFHINGRHIHS